MSRSDRKQCDFFPFKAVKPTLLNIQPGTFSTNKSRAAALLDEGKSLERNQDVFCLGNWERLRNTKTALYQDIRRFTGSNNTFIQATFHHKEASLRLSISKPFNYPPSPTTVTVESTFSQICCAIMLSYFWWNQLKFVFLLWLCSHRCHAERQTQDSGMKLLVYYGKFLDCT